MKEISIDIECIFRHIRTVNPELFGHYSGIIRTATYAPDTPCQDLNIILRENIICRSPDGL